MVLLSATLVVAGTTVFLRETPLGALLGCVRSPPLVVLLVLAMSGDTRGSRHQAAFDDQLRQPVVAGDEP
jgi:hypothetical protein